MYFDDVSPHHHIGWDPENQKGIGGNGFQPTHQSRPFPSSGTNSSLAIDPAQLRALEQQKRLQDDKQAMIRKFLTGYNARSASELTHKEIKRQTKFWSKESGVVRSRKYNYFGDDVLYDDVLGTSISNSTTLMGCLGDMWSFVTRDIIDAYAETEYKTAQHRWALRRKNDKYNKKPLRGSSHVFFCVFPHCPEAYDYKTFTMLVAALEFCKDLCVYMGKEFSVTLFHPKFKNSPSLLSPERHSPFPTIALQFGPAYKAEGTEGKSSIFRTRNQRPRPKGPKDAKRTPRQPPQVPQLKDNKILNDDLKRIRNGGSLRKDESEESEEDTEFEQLIERQISDLDGAKAHLEVLYNSAAASGAFDSALAHAAVDGNDQNDNDDLSFDDKESSDPPELDTSMLLAQFTSLTSSSNLTSDDIPEFCADTVARSFDQERKRRRRDIPESRVKDSLLDWAEKAKTKSDGTQNPALLYWDTLPTEHDWTICQDNTAEKAYASIWTTILELQEAGNRAPSVIEAEEQNKSRPLETETEIQLNEESKRKGRRFHLGDWLAGLSAENGQAPRPSSPRTNNMIPPTAIQTRVFVTTKFLPYNAQSFKRFAITVNAALKRFSDNRMFIEVFHPEYVGSQAFQNDSRRSPFPMLLICYHVKSS